QHNFSTIDKQLFLQNYGLAIHNKKQIAFSKSYTESNLPNYLLAVENKLKTNIKNYHTRFSNNKNTLARVPNAAKPLTTLLTGNCTDNPGFESGDTLNWGGASGVIGDFIYPMNYSVNTANNDPAQHTIVTNGNDEVGGFPRVCDLIPGNTTSLRLGNALASSGIENISYSFKVDALHPFFTYYYATVIQNGGASHFSPQQPYFDVKMNYGISNTPIVCASFQINGTNVASAGFTTVGVESYTAWRRVIIPLGSYIDSTVTITFETRDCAFGDHYCYTYIDADCGNPLITVPPINCNNGKSVAQLTAPSDQGSYTWAGPKIQGASNFQTVSVLDTGRWYCTITTKISPGGTACVFTLDTIIKAAPFIPVANFSYDPICNGQITNFTNLTTPAGIWTDYKWDVGNNGTIDAFTLDTSNVLLLNPTQQPKYVAVKLTMSNVFCTADTIVYVQIKPKPVANAGPDVQMCEGKSTTFSSSVATTYQWYEGLNIFNNQVGVSATYTTTPLVTVDYTLVISNQYQCTDTDDVHVLLNPTPQASFTAADVCYPNPTLFINTSTNTFPGDVYNWTFETGANSVLPNDSYTYSSCGTKAVKLVVTSPLGCETATANTINVLCKPNASITAGNKCRYDTIQYTANNIGITTISNYQWDFDYASATVQVGTPIANDATIKTPKNLYAVDGTKNIALIVTNTDGCQDTVVSQVTAYPIPVATFTTANVCKETANVFTSTSTINAPDNIAMYQWDFNNDAIYDQVSPALVQNYTYPFLYNGDAYLVAISNHGCIDTVSNAVQVYPLPLTSFTTNNECDGTAVEFVNTSTINIDTIVASKWNYTTTDSVLVAGIDTVNFLFAQGDVYPVTLSTITNNGCITSQTQLVTVYPKPIPNFNALQLVGCAPLNINAMNTSAIDASKVPTTIVAYTWYFGNGDSSIVKDPFYLYPSSTDNLSKIYTLQLKATSNFGCVTTETKTNYVEVYPQPIAGFLVTPITSMYSTHLIELFDKSSYSTNTTWTYGVDYIANNTSAPLYQTITYNDSGTYIISQYITNSFGCKDTAKEVITIKKDYNIYIPNAFTPNDDGINDDFVPKHFGITQYELTLFNRWGDQIAKVTEVNKNGWDGLDTRTSEKCKTDMYLWKLHYTTLTGSTGESNGKVTLLR
ncbi:MAG: gliding motility-associated C-terminal domain-containing protein, partial [Bacteroidia bacterium]